MQTVLFVIIAIILELIGFLCATTLLQYSLQSFAAGQLTMKSVGALVLFILYIVRAINNRVKED